MKKTNIFSKVLAVMLALCCLCGTAVSCAKIDNVYRHNSITAASSAADEYAELLAKKAPRLDIPVVIGTAADGSAYGIDMSEFENDGYIIKQMEGTAFVFGKTASALTTAVNKFANMYNAGAV